MPFQTSYESWPFVVALRVWSKSQRGKKKHRSWHANQWLTMCESVLTCVCVCVCVHVRACMSACVCVYLKWGFLMLYVHVYVSDLKWLVWVVCMGMKEREWGKRAKERASAIDRERKKEREGKQKKQFISGKKKTIISMGKLVTPVMDGTFGRAGELWCSRGIKRPMDTEGRRGLGINHSPRWGLDTGHTAPLLSPHDGWHLLAPPHILPSYSTRHKFIVLV